MSPASLSRFVPSLLLLTLLNGSCARQGEGDVCDVANGNKDCDQGLICVSHYDLAAGEEDRCCPPLGDQEQLETDRRCWPPEAGKLCDFDYQCNSGEFGEKPWFAFCNHEGMCEDCSSGEVYDGKRCGAPGGTGGSPSTGGASGTAGSGGTGGSLNTGGASGGTVSTGGITTGGSAG